MISGGSCCLHFAVVLPTLLRCKFDSRALFVVLRYIVQYPPPTMTTPTIRIFLLDVNRFANEIILYKSILPMVIWRDFISRCTVGLLLFHKCRVEIVFSQLLRGN